MDLLIYMIIGLSVWSATTTVYTGINLYHLIKQCHQRITIIDSIQFIISLLLTIALGIVLFIHPGLIYDLRSGMAPLSIGVIVILLHVSEYQWKRALCIRHFLSCQTH